MTARWAILLTVAAALAPPPDARAAVAPRVLRFCVDPNNMPFSNAHAEGLENRIAELVARELGARAEWVQVPQRRGFLRRRLKGGDCDVVPGIAAGVDAVLTTRPYYRSTYVLVSRADRRLDVRALDDPRLRSLRIGVQIIGDDAVSTPPAHALARLGLEDRVVGYSVFGDYGRPNPPARIVEAVANGEVDVAAVWGPLAGYFARRAAVPLRVVPLAPGADPALPYRFGIAMGVRKGDRALRDALDAALQRRSADVARILDDYGVPRV